MTAPQPPTLPRPADDELLARYHEAAALEGASPTPVLRAAVLAQAQILAWKHADEATQITIKNIAVDADSQSATADFHPEPKAPAPPVAAANDRRWLISAVASVAVLGLAGLLALQFERGPRDARGPAADSARAPAVDVTPRPADASAPATATDGASPAPAAAPPSSAQPTTTPAAPVAPAAEADPASAGTATLATADISQRRSLAAAAGRVGAFGAA